MHVVEIERQITALTERAFDPAQFLLDFVACFSASETTINRQQDGS